MEPKNGIQLDGEFVELENVLLTEDYIRECIVRKETDTAFDMGISDYLACEDRDEIESHIRNGFKGIEEMDMDEVAEYIQCEDEVGDMVEGFLGEAV